MQIYFYRKKTNGYKNFGTLNIIYRRPRRQQLQVLFLFLTKKKCFLIFIKVSSVTWEVRNENSHQKSKKKKMKTGNIKSSLVKLKGQQRLFQCITNLYLMRTEFNRLWLILIHRVWRSNSYNHVNSILWP